MSGFAQPSPEFNTPKKWDFAAHLPSSPLRQLSMELRSLQGGREDPTNLLTAVRRLQQGRSAPDAEQVADHLVQLVTSLTPRPTPSLLNGLIEVADAFCSQIRSVLDEDQNAASRAVEKICLFVDQRAFDIGDRCLRQSALCRLGYVYMETDRHLDADRAYRGALNLLDQHGDGATPAALHPLANLVRIGIESLDFEGCETYAKRLRAIIRSIRRPGCDPDLARDTVDALAACAELSRSRQDLPLAQQQYGELLRFMDREGIDIPVARSVTLFELGELAHESQQYLKALHLFEQALRALDHPSCVDSHLWEDIFLSMADSLGALGRFQEAEELRSRWSCE